MTTVAERERFAERVLLLLMLLCFYSSKIWNAGLLL